MNRNLSFDSISRRWVITTMLLAAARCVAISITCFAPLVLAQEASQRLLDHVPFDRITLNEANQGEVIDTLLLDLPNRTIPDPLPTSGTLELRRLSEPSTLYLLPWSSIARIELFEQLLLAEAGNLTKAGDLAQAYDYLEFLHKNYGDLNGLSQATEAYLRQDAIAAYRAQHDEEALTILLSLYDLNPKHNGLKNFLETATDRLINQYLKAHDYSAARQVLDMLVESFPQLNLPNIEKWRSHFQQSASSEIAMAQRAMKGQDFSTARQALRQALAIWPDVDGAGDLLAEIERQAPQVVVGVDQLFVPADSEFALDVSVVRTANLTNPKLLQLVDFGAEGGIYKSPWLNVKSDDAGMQLTIELSTAALDRGLTAERVALQLLRLANPTERQFRSDFANLLRQIEIRQGNQVIVHWNHAHVRPEAMLAFDLFQTSVDATLFGRYQRVQSDALDTQEYQLPNLAEELTGPATLIERQFDNEDEVIVGLVDGTIDVVAHVPPWQVGRLKRIRGIKVDTYQLPTVHVLLPNYDRPIMSRREFRRALSYGINRTQVLNDILLGGENLPGYRLLSGPLPAGQAITSPIGYAYNQGLQPRPYEPRLAAVLAAVARNSLAKKAAQQTQGNKLDETAVAEDDPSSTAVVPSLVLAHSTSPVATTACQSIKLHLDAIGIPVKLLPLDPHSDEIQDYDLRYAELAIWEPITDVRQLLGPKGIAGNCSSSMSLALRDVELATNWNDVRQRLHEVHQIAFNDLQVIPLWQTYDYFAYRDELQGIGESPVTLYQNISDWKRTSLGGVR